MTAAAPATPTLEFTPQQNFIMSRLAQRMRVVGGVYRNAGEPEVGSGAPDAQRDLSPVGNKYSGEHRAGSRMRLIMRGCHR